MFHRSLVAFLTGLLALLFGFFVAAFAGGLLLGAFAGLLVNLLLLFCGFLFGFFLCHGNLLHELNTQAHDPSVPARAIQARGTMPGE
jgi:uncharacterized membrane protein YdjX (TVP38/TMEM64 family)